jgi:hypothetical protein
VGVELLLVAQCLEVRLDGQRHDRGRAVCQVLLERFRVYAGRHGGCSAMGRLLLRRYYGLAVAGQGGGLMPGSGSAG